MQQKAVFNKTASYLDVTQLGLTALLRSAFRTHCDNVIYDFCYCHWDISRLVVSHLIGLLMQMFQSQKHK